MHLRTGLRAALDLAGLGAVDVVRGNPISIVGTGRRNRSAGGRLLGNRGLNALGATVGALLAGLSGLALLGEVGSDPNGVEEVTGARDTGQQEEVEEDTDGNC